VFVSGIGPCLAADRVSDESLWGISWCCGVPKRACACSRPASGHFPVYKKRSPKIAHEASTTVAGVPSCALDATNQFKITRSGFRFNNATQRFVQTITLQQLTLSPIQLPLSLVLDNLGPNATLFNKTGFTSCAVPAGSPFINVTGTSVVLEFTNPTNAGITYNTRVLQGNASR
jgi:hypothetical protein